MIDKIPLEIGRVIISYNTPQDQSRIKQSIPSWRSLPIHQSCISSVVLRKLGTEKCSATRDFQSCITTIGDRFSFLQEIHNILVPVHSDTPKKGRVHSYIPSKRLQVHPTPKPLSDFTGVDNWYNYHFPENQEGYTTIKIHPVYHCSLSEYLFTVKNSLNLRSLLY